MITTAGDQSEDVIVQMEALLENMGQAERLAHNQSSLVHVLTWEETQAGIWEPPPEDEKAVATFNGLLLNCVNSGLYMVITPCTPFYFSPSLPRSYRSHLSHTHTHTHPLSPPLIY